MEIKMNENFKEYVRQETEKVLRKAADETVFPAVQQVSDLMMKCFKAGLDAGVDVTMKAAMKID